MVKILYKLSLIIYVIFIITSCEQDKGKNIPDVSHIEVDVNINRFEKALFSLDTNNITLGLKQLNTAYPDFMNVYFTNIVANLDNPEETVEESASMLLRSPALQYLYDTCQLAFPELTNLEKDFEQMFKYQKHYFPDRAVPKVVTFISEYALGSFTLDDALLGIGLDFYLGQDHIGYSPMLFPDYIKRHMNKDHILSKAAETIASDIVGNNSGNRMLDLMIDNGKVLYIMGLLLPELEDKYIHCYTQEQVDWCRSNEMQIWALFLAEDLLYSSRMRDIQKLVKQSPNSPGMPPEAPGRTANWIGMKIVESYMKRNPDVSVQELVKIKDAQQILDKAKYKPR